MLKPSLQALRDAFPGHDTYPTLKDLYNWLGGKAVDNIYAEGFGPNGNTCASRMSVAFNKGGAPISKAVATAAGAETLGAGDKSRIIFKVAHFRKYLLATLGKPQLNNTSPFDDAFKGKRGIIAFSVNWSNASGHIALWNGASYREPGHDNYSTFVDPVHPNMKTSQGEFWELN